MTDSPPDKSSKRENSTPTPHSFLFSTTTLAVTLIRIGFLVPKEWLPFQTTTTGRTIGWLQFLNNKDMAPFWTSTLIRPHETWDHVREAQALRHLMGYQFRDAYRGSSVHVPPLVLAFCETILGLTPSQPLQSFVIGVGTHLMDLAIAITLLKLGNCVLKELREYPWEEEMQLRVPESLRPPLTSVFPISEHAVTYTDELPPRIALEEEKPGQSTEVNNEEQSKETIEDRLPPSFSWSGLPLLAAKLYYYCPITALASGLGSTHQSFQNLWLFLLLQSLHQGCGSPRIVPLSAFCLAMASYSELHFVVYLIPISLWLKRQKNSRSEVATLWGFYFFWVACLQGLTLLLVGQSQYTAVLQSSFGHTLTWKNLHPNLSVLWYLNMELFEQYRMYFSILIGGCPYLLVIPLTIRLSHYPMVLVTIFWMLWTLIRPTSTLVDANVAACLAVLCPRSVARMRMPTTLIPAFAIAVPISLYVVTLWMWLETGAGEANFTFFQCLAYCGFLATIFLEFAGSSLRRDKVLRFTEKLLEKKEAAEAITTRSEEAKESD